MGTEQFTNMVQSRVVLWLSGAFCDVIPSIPVDMIQYLEPNDTYLADFDPITACTINLMENL
jgi:hypothetical protein